MKNLTLSLVLVLLLGNNLFATEINGKDDIKVVSVNKVVRIKISDDLNDPLSVFLFDKKGNQLNYKFWENSRSRTIEFQVPADLDLKAYTIEVTQSGNTIFKKTFKTE
ncbi:MAG: hypothetical protein NXI20_11700 [bacterium]|nr:hypothetical protein [bacterium]